jgi:hypothetical protein
VVGVLLGEFPFRFLYPLLQNLDVQVLVLDLGGGCSEILAERVVVSLEALMARYLVRQQELQLHTLLFLFSYLDLISVLSRSSFFGPCRTSAPLECGHITLLLRLRTFPRREDRTH